MYLFTYQGHVSEDEMARTFNCGVGGVLIADHSNAQLITDRLRQSGQQAWVVGSVLNKGKTNVNYTCMSVCLSVCLCVCVWVVGSVLNKGKTK